jgi:hypothetical protein
MDEVVIRVRYRDLPPGLNGDAIHEDGSVVIYFAPGLTAQQRKAALRRLRQAASRGQKPPLPTLPLAVALTFDRLRARASTLAAIVRLHPAGTLLPAFGVVGLLAVFLFTSVSVHVLETPVTAGPGGVVGGSLPSGPSDHAHRLVPKASLAVSSGGSSGSRSTSQLTGTPIPVSRRSHGKSPGGSSGSPGPTPAPSVSPSVQPSVSPSVVPSPPPSGVISAQVNVQGASVGAHVSVGPAPHPSSPGACLDIGPFGICLSM